MTLNENDTKKENSQTEEGKNSEDPKKLMAETQLAIAELQKATAEAQKATIEALIPPSTLKPQEGKTEVEGKIGYIAELIAYQTLKEKAKEIGKEIDSKLEDKNNKILIVTDLDFATEDIPLLHWNALHDYFKESIDEQLKKYNEIDNLITPGAKLILGPAVIVAAVGVAADIIGYFKTDYKIYEQPISLQDHAIFANVLSSITKTPVYIFKFHRITESDVVKDFIGLLKKKNILDTNLTNVKVYQKSVDPEVLESNTQLRDMTNDFITSTETLLKAFSEFAESVTKSPEDKSPPLLIKAALRKYIEKEQFTHLLNLKILSAGGESVTMQQSFRQSGKLIFIGGCAVSYILVKIDGTYVMANTHNGLAHLHYDLRKTQESHVRSIKILDA